MHLVLLWMTKLNNWRIHKGWVLSLKFDLRLPIKGDTLADQNWITQTKQFCTYEIKFSGWHGKCQYTGHGINRIVEVCNEMVQNTKKPKEA